MKKEDKKKNTEELTTVLSGKYKDSFDVFKKGEKRNLKDTKSDKNTFIPIESTEDDIYIAEPEKKLIPDAYKQKKCDYLIFCIKKYQTLFIELKGENISSKKDYNPYSQIIDTITFLQGEEELKVLVNAGIEKHAFIVSPGRQKIPKGIDSKERQLWQKLTQHGASKTKISDLVHYVKVTKTDRYSNKNNQIICSPKSPIKIPFKNQE